MHQSNHTPEQRGVDVYYKGRIYLKYIHAQFGRPDHWNTESEAEHNEAYEAFMKHLESFTNYELIGPHSFKDGEDVTGRYELNKQWRGLGYWIPDEYYDGPKEGERETRTVATPLPSKGQEGEAARKEYILCAAIWYKDQPTPKIQVANVDTGLVLCGHRHGHIIHQFVALTGKRSVETECGRYVQGFLTNAGRFVNRKEAMNIAKESGQVTKAQSFEELFSEDLY